LAVASRFDYHLLADISLIYAANTTIIAAEIRSATNSHKMKAHLNSQSIMNTRVHQLAIFWRDQAARSMTYLHFLPAPGEHARTRAALILDALIQSSALQVYGAALDDNPVSLPATRPAPQAGTDVRLHVNLFPAEKVNPRAGINYLRFTVPGPIDELIEAVEDQKKGRFDLPAWRRLEKEIFPFICLPKGIKAAPPPAQIKRAEIAFLDLEHRPQPGQNPINPAMGGAEARLQRAQDSLKNIDTPAQRQRPECEQKRLDHYYAWLNIERSCFEQIDQLSVSLPMMAPPARESASTPLYQSVSAALINSEMPKMLRERKEESLPKETVKEESVMKIENPASPAAVIDDIYLPAKPSDPSVWADVPPEHFQVPDMWLRRLQFKDIYHISDRAYFRFVERLKENGLHRSLPASRDSRVTLFYKPDIEMVSAKVAQAAAVPHRGQNFKAIASIIGSLPHQQLADVTPAAPQPSTPAPTAPMAPTTPQMPAAIATTPAIATAALSVDAEALALLRSQQIALQQQNASLTAAIARLEASLQQLQLQYDALRAHIQPPPNVAPQSHITAQDSHPSSEMSVLLAKLNKVDRALQRLPQRLLDSAPVNKSKPKTKKSKSKKPAARSRSVARTTPANKGVAAKSKSRRR
jgi:hypothetical protein